LSSSASRRRHREVGFEQAHELDEGLVVEHDAIDVVEFGARGFEAIVDGPARIVRVELLAREPFFLGGCDDVTVLDQRRRAVVIERRDAQDAVRRHQNSV